MPWINGLDIKVNYYNSVADMKSDMTLKDGKIAVTLGYYEPNDGGGATFRVREKITTDVDDGGSIHILANDCVAEMLVNNIIKKSDGHHYLYIGNKVFKKITLEGVDG